MRYSAPLTALLFIRGYTLIEMLVVLAITGLLVGGSIVGYNKFNDRQVVSQAGKLLASTLRTAQIRARVGDKPSVGCTTLNGYRVIGSVAASTYDLRVVCDDADAATINTVTLPFGVVVRQAFSILFPVVSGGAVGASSAGTAVAVQNNVASGGYRYTVTVYASGAIDETGLTSF